MKLSPQYGQVENLPVFSSSYVSSILHAAATDFTTFFPAL